MNIAVFIKRTTFHKGHGGLETQNKVLCEGLRKKGHTITVFSPKWNLDLNEANESGIKYIFVECVYRMGPVFGFFGTLQKENWINRSVEEFSTQHNKQSFDLVLAQSSTGLGVIKRKTSHSLNPVPCVIYDPASEGEYQNVLKEGLGISSIPATVMNLLGYDAPEDYDASVLVAK